MQVIAPMPNVFHALIHVIHSNEVKTALLLTLDGDKNSSSRTGIYTSLHLKTICSPPKVSKLIHAVYLRPGSLCENLELNSNYLHSPLVWNVVFVIFSIRCFPPLLQICIIYKLQFVFCSSVAPFLSATHRYKQIQKNKQAFLEVLSFAACKESAH